ncbi:MAG: PIN domain-containing protein [Acidimicrobiaceae bacterium]|nr:PIN domain-containing protein [Acidimicrobiaceae bacterium]
MTVVLDSWAILEYLEDREPAASAVAGMLGTQRPIISWINLGEVFYVIRRRHADAAAHATVRDLRDVATAELPNARRVLEAARIKSDYTMAYADAFAAATAAAHGATLWTGDPELLIDSAPWTCRDLRQL